MNWTLLCPLLKDFCINQPHSAFFSTLCYERETSIFAFIAPKWFLSMEWNSLWSQLSEYENEENILYARAR